MPGYNTFPFVWFLITLFHDHAYQIEGSKRLSLENRTLQQLQNNYQIDHHLLLQNFTDFPEHLINSCNNYFEYRIKVWEKVDHGIFAGLILFDRLVKIRLSHEKDWKETLFWGTELEEQYKLAAITIACHNIWMPTVDQHELYRQYNLSDLIDLKPIKFDDFQLLYLFGIVDTIDPIKIFTNDGLTDEEILGSIFIEFKSNGIIFSKRKGSKIDFKKLINQANMLEGWLDIDNTLSNSMLQITFK